MLRYGNALVPWNAMWSGEDRHEIRPCRHCDGAQALWQPHLPGAGRPIFAKPHAVRQRKSVADYICTVCGEHTPPDDRWWFGVGVETKAGFTTTESPVHKACATLALEVCPYLASLGREARPFPANGLTMIAAVVGGPEFEQDFGVRIPKGKTVFGHLKFHWPRRTGASLWWGR